MLRITKQTDYAIMLLGQLATCPTGGWMTTRDAAAWSGVSVPMVSKILKSLVRRGMVVSHRGMAGGYNLGRPLQAISLADVIRALEGPISMVECHSVPGQCGHEPTCSVRVNWKLVNREIEHTLERIPVSRMATMGDSALLHLGTANPPALGIEPRP